MKASFTVILKTEMMALTVIWWVLIWNNTDHIQCLLTLNSDDDFVGKYYQHSQFYNEETELTRLSNFPTLMYLEYISKSMFVGHENTCF